MVERYTRKRMKKNIKQNNKVMYDNQKPGHTKLCTTKINVYQIKIHL